MMFKCVELLEEYSGLKDDKSKNLPKQSWEKNGDPPCMYIYIYIVRERARERETDREEEREWIIDNLLPDTWLATYFQWSYKNIKYVSSGKKL